MEKRELIEKLTRARIATTTSAKMAGEDCFVFRDGKLFATNQRSAVILPFDAPISGAINADSTMKLVKTLRGDNVEISQVTKGIQFKDESKVRIVMSLCEESISNWIKAINHAEHITKGISDIATPLELTMLTKGDRELNGVYVSGCNMYATDGYRINRTTFDGQFDPLWINDRCAYDVIDFSDVTSYMVENSWLHLIGKQGQFSCRRRDHTGYPSKFVENIDSLLDGDHQYDNIDLILFLYDNIKIAKNISTDGKVKVVCNNDYISVECASGQGEYHNSFDMEIGINAVFTITANFVLDMLRKDGIESFGVVNGSKKIFYAKGSHKGCDWVSLVSVE